MDIDEEIDIAYIPPNVDELTDEENIDDNEMGDIQNLPRDLAGTFDIMTPEDDESTPSSDTEKNIVEISDIQNRSNTFDIITVSLESETKPSSSTKKRVIELNKSNNKKQKTQEPVDVIWGKTSIDYERFPKNTQEQDIQNISENLHGKSPYEFFKLFVDEEVMQTIVDFSMKYALIEKNNAGFIMNLDDLEVFFGILILSGYHTLPQVHMYWSTDADKGVQIVKDSMSRNKFYSIKENLHLSDNNKLDKTDKFAKLTPVFDLINQKFKQFGIFAHNLSIDEQMVPYFGKHSAKMFIKGKPVRFGFKLWCLASADGYLFHFIPYSGKSDKERVFGLGGEVITSLLGQLENPNNHKVYFDNFFTSYTLMVHLQKQGFFATGTVRANRIQKCPVEPNKSIAKKTRGTYDARYDYTNDISLVRWNDNAVVTVMSNFESVEPIVYVPRYNRKERKDVQVPQPNMIQKYNKYMGGVDLHDNGVANYRIKIRGKKWWWPLFSNLIDSAIVNAWKLHRYVHSDDKISQINFRSELARCLLQKSKTVPINRRRSGYNVLDEIRFDNVGHIIESDPKCRNRCTVCKSNTIYFCRKCKKQLHVNCFNLYHKPN